MKIPGVDSILNKHASAVWGTEQIPDPELVTFFEAAQAAIEDGDFATAEHLLMQMSKRDLLPSQDMRRCYLLGMFFSDQRDYGQAYLFYDQALNIAVDHSDLSSRLLLTFLAGLVLYGALRNYEAIEYYQEALDIWHVYSRTMSHPLVEPEVTFLEALGKSQWNVGQFGEAHGTLARIVALAQNRRNTFRDKYLSQLYATALWTLALVLRSQSDMVDGDENHIRTALRRGKKAVGLYRSLHAPKVYVGRLYVQIAELYLDLAELHFVQGKRNAARAMYHEGHHYAQSASEILDSTTDTSGKLLAKLTLLRHDIMDQTPRETLLTVPQIESRLSAIERAAAKLRDEFISAKAATLRGEWLLALGDKDAAQLALSLALQGFEPNGSGMATRALRLLRQINQTQTVTSKSAHGVTRLPRSGPIREEAL